MATFPILSLRGGPQANEAIPTDQRQPSMEDKLYCVYILANERHTVLYTGVTGDLPKRLYEHKNKLTPGFTSRYNADRLVWYEPHGDACSAISREKQIKGGSRLKKIRLIEEMNPEWHDLAVTL